VGVTVGGARVGSGVAVQVGRGVLVGGGVTVAVVATGVGVGLGSGCVAHHHTSNAVRRRRRIMHTIKARCIFRLRLGFIGSPFLFDSQIPRGMPRPGCL